jgi:GNAT superfamily N-acetyltransferase
VPSATAQTALIATMYDMIRPATEQDVPAIARLIRALAEYERLSHRVIFDEVKLRDHLFGSRPYAEVLLAEERGAVVGFALFFHNYSTFAGRPGIYLEDLFVEPQHRGKGLGKALLASLAKIATERDCVKVEWTVLDWNQPAIDFYQKLGAAHLKEWQIYRLAGDALRRMAENPT